jgi:hypothetical protein
LPQPICWRPQDPERHQVPNPTAHSFGQTPLLYFLHHTPGLDVPVLDFGLTGRKWRPAQAGAGLADNEKPLASA